MFCSFYIKQIKEHINLIFQFYITSYNNYHIRLTYMIMRIGFEK